MPKLVHVTLSGCLGEFRTKRTHEIFGCDDKRTQVSICVRQIMKLIIHGCLEEPEKIFSEDPIQAFGSTAVDGIHG